MTFLIQPLGEPGERFGPFRERAWVLVKEWNERMAGRAPESLSPAEHERGREIMLALADVAREHWEWAGRPKNREQDVLEMERAAGRVGGARPS